MMYCLPDHPAIRQAELEGMPEPELEMPAEFDIEEEPWEREEKWWESESNG